MLTPTHSLTHCTFLYVYANQLFSKRRVKWHVSVKFVYFFLSVKRIFIDCTYFRTASQVRFFHLQSNQI